MRNLYPFAPKRSLLPGPGVQLVTSDEGEVVAVHMSQAETELSFNGFNGRVLKNGGTDKNHPKLDHEKVFRNSWYLMVLGIYHFKKPPIKL